MAAFNKFNQTSADLGNGVHVFSTHVLKVMLTNVAPVATNSIKANLTEIAAGNGYTAGGTAIGSVTWGQTAGVAKLTGADVVFTASGGTIGPFQYAVAYNDTPTSPADPLLAWWDRGTPVTLLNGESFTVDYDAVAGILTIT